MEDEEHNPPIPIRVPPTITLHDDDDDDDVERKRTTKKKLLKRRSSSRRRNSGVHDRVIPPKAIQNKGLLSPIRITLSDDVYTSSGPVRTDSVDMDTVTGWLLKRSKHIHRFQKRYFSLSISEGSLAYYMRKPEIMSSESKIKVPRGVFQIIKESQVLKDPSDPLVFKVTVHEMRSGTPLKRKPMKSFEDETKSTNKKMMSLFLKSDTEDDVERWLSAFRSSVNRQQLHKKKISPTNNTFSQRDDDNIPPMKPPKVKKISTGWFNKKNSSVSNSASSSLETENREIKNQLDTCLKQMRELTKESERLEKEKSALASKSDELEKSLKSIETKHQSSLKERDEKIDKLREALEHEKRERERVQREERRRLTQRIERLEKSQKCGANCVVQ